MTEKTSTPIGSRRRRPTGYRYRSCLAINLVVVHTITVLKRSSAPSTRDARTDSELVSTMTAILPPRRTIFAARFTYMASCTILSPLSTLSSVIPGISGLGPSSSSESSKSGVSSVGTLYKSLGVRFIFLLPELVPLGFLWPPDSAFTGGCSSDMVAGTPS